MRTRLGWLCVGGAIGIVGFGTLLWTATEQLPRTPMNSKREVRIRKISLGTNHLFVTEPFWKRTARRVVPQRWRGFLGPSRDIAFSTRESTLVLFADVFDHEIRRVAAMRLDKAEAILARDAPAGGNVSAYGSFSRAQFTVFDRAKAMIPVRLTFGADVVELAIKNPKPAVQAKWFAQELPQTNTVAGTEVILRRLSRNGTGTIHTRGSNREPTGWTSWQITAFDSWGNWVTGDGTYSLRLSSSLPASELLWKVQAEGLEYVSAAFVQVPTPGEHAIITPKPRLQSQGIQFLMWTGPGHYSVSDRFEVLCTGAGFSASNSLSALVNGSWELTGTEPGVLCISDGLVRPSVRLRERLEQGGRIFPNGKVKTVSRSTSSAGRIAQVFTPRLPSVTTNLEVEVILRLPSTEFFVNAPR